jgi:hypothetical protein
LTLLITAQNPERIIAIYSIGCLYLYYTLMDIILFITNLARRGSRFISFMNTYASLPNRISQVCSSPISREAFCLEHHSLLLNLTCSFLHELKLSYASHPCLCLITDISNNLPWLSEVTGGHVHINRSEIIGCKQDQYPN